MRDDLKNMMDVGAISTAIATLLDGLPHVAALESQKGNKLLTAHRSKIQH